MPNGISAAPSPVQPPANAPGKAPEGGLSHWAPYNYTGARKEAPGFWFQPGPALITGSSVANESVIGNFFSF